MPRFDKTGPMGYGPMTGRGMGPCNGGLRRGRGLGRGYGWQQVQRVSDADEKKMLTEYVKDLEEELKVAKEEMTKLEK